MAISNVRLIWYSDLSHDFNVTIPYCMIVRTLLHVAAGVA